MPICVRWYDPEETIQVFEVVAPWSVDDIYSAVDKGYQMSQHKPYFDIIYDLRRSQSIPTNFRSSISYMSRMKQPQVGMRVVIGMGRLIPLILALVRALKPDLIAGIHTADTPEDSLTIIQGYRKEHLKDY